MSINKWLLVVLALFWGCAVTPEKPISVKIAPNEHIIFGYPGQDCQILFRKGYTLCHDQQTKVADWASYHMTGEYLVSGVQRTDDFRADPDLSPGQRAELSDYRNSGYDRGHLVPAADMARSPAIMSESFLLSNMTPQLPGFNRGIWKNLEDDVRKWVKAKKNLYIMTGPLFLDEPGRIIGQVKVPSHFFKIVVSGNPDLPATLDAIAFIIPNVAVPSDRLRSFVVNIDAIEAKSGLDFLHDLDDAIENKLEAKKPTVDGWL